MSDVTPRLRRSYRAFLWLGGCSILLLVLAVAAFLRAGSWLVREDPPQKVQIVVVLSGGLPERALAAAQEFKATGASAVWLTRPRQPGAAMQELRLPYAGEDQYSRMVLIERGVPAAAIRTLNPAINNTSDELKAVFEELKAHPGETVVVVTSKAHTRRVRAVWNVISDGKDRRDLLLRAAPEDPFDAQHWWRSSNDALSVVREYLGLLNAWFGLPLNHGK
jgi:uncharacterized SAM-binding protein YcdF (DUF218 family)